MAIKARSADRPPSEAQATKRRKVSNAGGSSSETTPARPRKRQTPLQEVVGMPLDIIFEIFSYLGPHDVLRLSRATKSLRSVLMHPSAAFVWRAALENDADVRKRPDDMSEPAYVSLVFDTHCQFCQSIRSTRYWECRVRSCKGCFKKNFVKFEEDHPFAEYLEKFLPFVVVKEKREDVRYCAKDIFKPLEDELKEMQSEEPKAFDEWTQKKLLEFRHMIQREEEKCALIRQRKDDIRQRLYALGWPRVLAHECTHFTNGKLTVEMPQPLDDVPPTLHFEHPWNYQGGNVAAYPEASQIIRSIVELCGLNPELATSGDLHERKVMLGCGHPACCPKNDPEVTKLAFRWMGAVDHALRVHAADLESVTFRVLEGQDSADAQERELEAFSGHMQATTPAFSCLHCASGRPGSYRWIEAHLEYRHGVDTVNMLVGTDYAIHLDAPLSFCSPTVKLDWRRSIREKKTSMEDSSIADSEEMVIG